MADENFAHLLWQMAGEAKDRAVKEWLNLEAQIVFMKSEE